ncbi:hypothetical protein GGF41_006475, partial [Coemansia sp. RSA 2531]
MVEQEYFTNVEAAQEFRSDLTRWRLNVDNGRQRWEYVSESTATERPQSFYEKYWLGLAVDMAELPQAT